MDFKEKYLKYKKKYLELKNQIGGWDVCKVKKDSNSIRINNLPDGTTSEHLEGFLKSKGIPIHSRGTQLNNDFLINFKDNTIAISNVGSVMKALSSGPYDPRIPLVPSIVSTPPVPPSGPPPSGPPPSGPPSGLPSSRTPPSGPPPLGPPPLGPPPSEATKGWKVLPVLKDSNSIRINDLPKGTTSDHLEIFLKNKGIPIASPGTSKKNYFLINFIDNATAKSNVGPVIRALSGPPPLPSYDPMVSIISAPAPVPASSVKPPNFLQPWPNPSKLLFIALPIAKTSELGDQIDYRVKVVTTKSPFENDQTKTLKNPHITLLSIYIPTGSWIDKILSNKDIFPQFVKFLRSTFINFFKIEDVKPYQLHSQYNNYKNFNKWIIRAFDDTDYKESIETFKNFREFITYSLLTNGMKFDISKINELIKVESDFKPFFAPSNLSPPTFTHYSIKPRTYPYSDLAISSWYINWIPHISLYKIESGHDKFIEEIKKVAKKPMSFINLWKVDQQKTITISKDNDKKFLGSLEYIYCSYGSGADQQFVYEKL